MLKFHWKWCVRMCIRNRWRPRRLIVRNANENAKRNDIFLSQQKTSKTGASNDHKKYVRKTKFVLHFFSSSSGCCSGVEWINKINSISTVRWSFLFPFPFAPFFTNVIQLLPWRAIYIFFFNQTKWRLRYKQQHNNQNEKAITIKQVFDLF